MRATTVTHVTTINPINTNIHGPVIDEVEGLIRFYKDGHVERFQLVPCVGPSLPLDLGVACSDVHIDKLTNIWARLYVPLVTKSSPVFNSKLPLLVYFHGGGFCVGSASWSCYHEFLARLSASSRCIIMSVNYRLAPENPLPAAYEDGVNAIIWLKKTRKDNLWSTLCDFKKIFLAGDSAGGNIAHNVAARLRAADALIQPLKIEGTILIQPFFGGEARTESERRVENNAKSSVLTLAASDAWWRLALPGDANREHPYCKPVKINTRTLVCVAEMDVLMDREMEMCDGSEKMIKRVVYQGVGHAFQILGKSQLAHTMTQEMLCHIDDFIHQCDSSI
ncbi:putative carboxylesterase 6 [Raphanus sativus]|uniref:Probable carboxylesterase 6 n=1 Tax=Raphanus sativus TaxID=3726 RepID=A0A6J0M922_RAPSA|nr:probable carboxylesterase 6 [Raphanus sativus]KAJ4909736.1 putative carboxylesterase 6 [Raphanus sativus]